ncbi:hypothetical protein [Streptomyces sp. NPDC048659]|uniref:hypothetical protein n=1 Tax=Streptomyces sp. NPDC048659 TaxID=3155489 RepID=UPI0034385B86
MSDMSWFTPARETSGDDLDRTDRLIAAADIAFDAAVPGADPAFESVVVDGLLSRLAAVYPPAGHTYPKKDR